MLNVKMNYSVVFDIYLFVDTLAVMLELAFECESQLFMLWVVLYMIFAFNVFMFMCACFCIMYSLSEIEWAFLCGVMSPSSRCMS